jgi:4-amino-4-deoxy-L-arabinose transferase-like glycosyltransferase
VIATDETNTQLVRDARASSASVYRPMITGRLLTARRALFAAAAIVLLTVVIRLPALVQPQPIDDEAVYSVVANEVVDGGRPYRDAIERKPPLLFWTYAAVFKVAGKYNWHALHALALIWTLGTMAGLYVIGTRVFDRETGFIAALFYSVFQPWAVGDNLAFNGELLMNLPIVWAWAMLLGRRYPPKWIELVGAGCLLCLGFLLKQPAAIAAVPLAIYLLLPGYRKAQGITLAKSLIHAAVLTLGFFSTLALVAFVLHRQRILKEAFYWTFTNHSVPYVFWFHGLLQTLAFGAACLPVLIGAAMALRDRAALWKTKQPERLALLGLLAASAIGAAAGGRFYSHYYIQLVPALVLLAARYYAISRQRWFFAPRVTCIWLTLTVIAFSISHWVSLSGERQPSETARYLAAHSRPSDRIFIWGRSAARVYLQAQRRPACRYVLTFPLTGFIFGEKLPGVDTTDRIVPGAWRHLEEDFHAHPPLYIADFYAAPDAQYPAKNFPILAELLAKHYQLVATTEQGLIYRAR